MAWPRRLLVVCCTIALLLGLQELQAAAQSAPKLPDSEIAALKAIKTKLRIETWDFEKNPCSGVPPWGNATVPSGDISNNTPVSNLTCGDCNSTQCHVISILLKAMNLSGFLPEDFANLTHLSVLDLTRNYINGSIPKAWSSLPLVSISLIGNRISGMLPEEIGNITTLTSLVLENNLMEGHLPQSLGKLKNLRRLFLSANKFIGVLPQSMGNLSNMADFRIDGTGISGKIPDFIGNWTNLTRLDMQGTSLEGPIPNTFSNLRNLKDLKVTDLNGTTAFPPLEELNLNYLILRNCSIAGVIPDYIGRKENLRTLDLSFNNFTGEIPSSFEKLVKASLTELYLTNNRLTGVIPDWMFGTERTIDLSYNSFTGPDKSGCSKPQVDVNMVSSFSSIESNSITPCLRKNLPCAGTAKNYQLFINCGGGDLEVDGINYEADLGVDGAATFFLSGQKNWGYSSTGDFISNSRPQFKVGNMTDPRLYMSARTSASSLRYYGLCLQSGNYTVKLHFAEIIFTNDQSFSSTGRRLFDVLIQGETVLKDFNIAEAANGTGREIVKSFTAYVDQTLEIHFRWLGKGTNAIPDRGIYGPLISAISVTPNFEPVLDEKKKFPTGAIVAIAIGSCVILLLIVLVPFFLLQRKEKENEELKQLKLQGAYFSLKQLKVATKNFDPSNKIGEGGFGPVYKGELADGSSVAVKQLSSKSKQGNREFVTEIGMITAFQHPNLVKLFGCCIEGNQLMLIYEYMENNSLARALFGPEEKRLHLDWHARHRISLDIARGLAYLHEGSALKIVHRDIKATNILLDKDLNAKISDFGLAKLDEEENTHISTRIAGTVGYMAPEYAMRGHLTEKADIYSFGIVIMEIVSGKSNASYKPKEDFIYLLDWAYFLKDRGMLHELIDPRLGSNYSKIEAEIMLELALVCTSPSPALRPKMSTAVRILEGKESVPTPVARHGRTLSEELRYKAFEKLSRDSIQSVSSDGPWHSSGGTNGVGQVVTENAHSQPSAYDSV